MSVFVVRIAAPSMHTFLTEPCGHIGLATFKQAHLFTDQDEAKREAALYPSWREVLEVWWKVVWYERGRPKPHGGKVECKTFDSAKAARASFYWRLAYGSGGEADRLGYKVVRVMRRVKS